MKQLIYILFLLLLFSCTKDEIGPQCISCVEESTPTESADLLIINEGNFGFGNASITRYKPSNQLVSQNVFFQANNVPLGDVGQSITQINNNAYLVVNNSSKIEVVELGSFNSVATITGFNSPRFLLPINNTKAYVTDLFSNSIQIVDLANNVISGSIALSGWTEELILHNDSVYVCDMTNDNLLIINPAIDVLIDSVKLGVQPNSMVKDQNNRLWILCDGGYLNLYNPQLIKYNPQTRTIEATYVFPNLIESPTDLKINAAGDQLYFINSAVYRMGINAATLPATPFIPSNSNVFYGLGIDPVTEDVYVSDALDFVQNGVIFRYSSSGSLIHQFNSGIIPGDFIFVK